MNVLCKFKVSSIELVPYGGWGEEPKTIGRRIKLQGVQSPPFGKATPSAGVDMLIVNPEAAEQFELDGEYEVTFVKVTDGLRVRFVTG